MTSLRINKAHYPVTVLGPGQRLGIWVQGCSIGCNGCLSKDTWDAQDGAAIALDALVGWVQALAADCSFQGITISGGEPFDQPEALYEFLVRITQWREAVGASFDVLCYSGYPQAKLEREHAKTLALVDLLCPEPFIAKRGAGGLWRGSANQPLLTRTARGQSLMEKTSPKEENMRLQTDVSGGRVWFIGIPAPDDMNRLEKQLRASGMNLEGVSWRA